MFQADSPACMEVCISRVISPTKRSWFSRSLRARGTSRARMRPRSTSAAARCASNRVGNRGAVAPGKMASKVAAGVLAPATAATMTLAWMIGSASLSAVVMRAIAMRRISAGDVTSRSSSWRSRATCAYTASSCSSVASDSVSMRCRMRRRTASDRASVASRVPGILTPVRRCRCRQRHRYHHPAMRRPARLGPVVRRALGQPLPPPRRRRPFVLQSRRARRR